MIFKVKVGDKIRKRSVLGGLPAGTEGVVTKVDSDRVYVRWAFRAVDSVDDWYYIREAGRYLELVS